MALIETTEPAENESPAPVSELLSSALSCKEVQRKTIGNTFIDARPLIAALVLILDGPVVVFLAFIIYAFGGHIELGFLAILILFMILRPILILIVGGELLSFINCKIAGYEHGWREYQIFMSAMVWIGVARVLMIALLLVGIRVRGIEIMAATVPFTAIVTISMAIVASRYVAMNYPSELMNTPGSRAMHQTYAAFAFCVLSYLL